MGSFTVGDIVLISFPYADFSNLKKRPALVIGEAEFSNLILCQITSKAETSKKAIPLIGDDFVSGSLYLDSYIRPDKIFTVEQSIVKKKMGTLKRSRMEIVKFRDYLVPFVLSGEKTSTWRLFDYKEL
jgi:mRNA interferase MazF